MLALTILSIFILIIVLIIVIEYRNEKKYQAKRRTNTTNKKKSAPSKLTVKVKPKTVLPKAEPKPEPKVEPKAEPRTEPKPELKTETPKEVVEVVETKKLPEASYPKFTHVRLVEMGLSDEEAKEFVGELIPQIETEIPLIEVAMKDLDFHKMERLTHGIKGSATNLGTGGVSDLLVDCNTYLKTGTDIDIAKAYFEHLVHYTEELKDQYTH